MDSRYDYMKECDSYDTDNERWPDPLSVSYNDVSFTRVPTEVRLGSGDIDKFWLWMQRNYGISELDDILLNINCIPYMGMEKPGDIIYKVSLEDIVNSQINKISGSETEE